MECIVYQIRDKINDKKYIGSTQNYKVRVRSHKNRLLRGCNENEPLQQAYNQTGADNFEYYKIESCTKENQNERETYWIKLFGKEMLYNISVSATRKGSKLTAEQVENLKIIHPALFKKGVSSWNAGTKGTGIVKPNKGSFKPKQFSVVCVETCTLIKGVGISSFAKSVGVSKSGMANLIHENELTKIRSGYRLPHPNETFDKVIHWKPNKLTSV